MKLQRIVIGIDFSPASVRAATWVARVLAPDADVLLSHIIEIPAPRGPLRALAAPPPALEAVSREGAEHKLRELSRTVHFTRSWAEARAGDPAGTIAAVADEFDADLVVIGARRDGTGMWNWLGSTAERLIGHARVPVLLAANPGDSPPSHVLGAVDGSPVSDRVEAWTHELARRLGARHTQLTVVRSEEARLAMPVAVTAGVGAATRDESAGPPAEGRDEWIRRELGPDGSPGDRPELAVGAAGHSILAAAQQHGSGLIVIGRRGTGRARHALFGSVTREVLLGARCPVLVVMEPPQ